jgi:hypothetical protein
MKQEKVKYKDKQNNASVQEDREGKRYGKQWRKKQAKQKEWRGTTSSRGNN